MAEAERDDKFVEKKKVEETEWNERQEGSLVFRQKTATKMVKVTNADLYIRFLKVKGKRALTQQLEKKQIESKVSESKERTKYSTRGKKVVIMKNVLRTQQTRIVNTDKLV